jgi:septum formation protein
VPEIRQPLVLGSSSPFRRELLARLGMPFETSTPDIDETPLPGESPRATALRLAEAKARAVALRFPQALIIGSDQVACIGTRVFGKPQTHQRAVAQLREMSGQTVSFETALCLHNPSRGRTQIDVVPTAIRFRRLDDDEIDAYLRRDEPYGCAGSARIESLGIALIERMTSDDPTAIVGLPLIRLCGMLADEGIRVI